MPFNTSIEKYQQDQHNLPKSSPAESTGFFENWNARLGLMITEDLPIVSRMIPSITESMRKKKLYDYAEVYPELKQRMANVWSLGGDTDVDAAAYYANKTLGLTDIPILEDYDKRKDEEYDSYRTYSNDIANRASIAGKFGSFATAPWMALDPIYAVGFFTGYGGASTALQAITRVGLIEAGAEVVATPFIMDWKTDIGTEYSGAEALINIAATGITAGLLGGAGKYLELKGKAKYDKAFSHLDIRAPEYSVADYSKYFKDQVAKNPKAAYELNSYIKMLDNYPDQTANAADVLRADVAFIENLNNQGPPAHMAKATNKKQTVQAFDVEQRQILDATPRKEAAKIDELVIEDEIATLQREVIDSPEVQKLNVELDKYRDWYEGQRDVISTKIATRIKEIQKVLRSEDILDAKKQVRELEQLKKTISEEYRELPDRQSLIKMVDDVSKALDEVEPKVKAKVTKETQTLNKINEDVHKIVAKNYNDIKTIDTTLDEIENIKARDC